MRKNKFLEKSRPFRILNLVITAGTGSFILLKDWDLSRPEFFVVGLAIGFVGLLMIVLPGKSWSTVFSMILTGLYCLLRSVGKIDQQYFRYGVGLTLLAISALHVYQLINKDAHGSETRG